LAQLRSGFLGYPGPALGGIQTIPQLLDFCAGLGELDQSAVSQCDRDVCPHVGLPNLVLGPLGPLAQSIHRAL